MSTINTAIPYTQRVEQIEAVAVAGQNGFFLPFGTFIRGEDVLSVEVDGVVLTPGLPAPAPPNDYVPMLRQARSVYTQPPGGPLTGILSWTNGGTTVTGVGTSFTTEVAAGQYIWSDSDPYSAATQVGTVVSDTQITLATPYGGTTGAMSGRLALYLSGWTQPSTADVVRGVWLTVPPGPGRTVRITFVTRVLLLPAPVPFVTYAPGGVLPSGIQVMMSYNVPMPLVPQVAVPSQVLVVGREGLRIEFWRRTAHCGKVHTSAGIAFTQVRTGRFWSPYWRAPVAGATGDAIIDPVAERLIAPMPPGHQLMKRQYRLTYFDPASGARTSLSDLTLYIANRRDRLGKFGAAPPVTPPHQPDGVQASVAWVGR